MGMRTAALQPLWHALGTNVFALDGRRVDFTTS
ncbi:hypothetical protein EDC27_1825 [Desulfosoma caldarium]|uniref:Uncharacterized protein n=1 Tax=Desulfosoma caldarium TaxID=610254 RepID=A0A3N1ULP3_9BACT|nr:hypothetical protein EDC27_1825 [Desulfosoma caldarium]